MPFSYCMASRTRLRRVAGIDCQHTDAREQRLVANHLLQLPEWPSVQPGAHALARLDSFPNVRQILKHKDSDVVLFGLIDDLSADAVVDMPDVAAFSARGFAKMLSGTLRAIALKPRTVTEITVTVVFDLSSFPNFPG